MKRMLSYEIFKLKKSKYWWICSLVIMFMTGLSVLGIYYGNSELSNVSDNNLATHMLTFTLFKPAILGQNSLLIAIIIGTLICSDFSNGTIKNVSSKGISRTQIVLSKMIIGSALGILLILVKLLTGLFLGYMMIGFSNVANSFWIDLFKTFLVSILQTIAYVGIFTLSGFIFRKTSSSITLNIILTIFIPIIIFIITVYMKWKEYNIGFDINLIIPKSILGLSMTNIKDLTIYCFIMLFYIVAGLGLSIYLFNKNDIK